MFDKIMHIHKENIIDNNSVEKENNFIKKFNAFKYIISATALFLGIFIQIGFLNNYFGNFYPSILYINIDFSIILIVLFLFIISVSIFVAYFGTIIFFIMIVITIIIAIYQKICIGNINLKLLESPLFMVLIIIISIIGGGLLLNYQDNIKKKFPFIKNKIIIFIIWFTFLSFLVFSIYSLSNINYQIKYKTKTQSGTGKVIFYNGENYFLDTKDGKKIIPVKSIEIIEKIKFPIKNP